MPIHDYLCHTCNKIVEDQLAAPTECECGNPKYEWTCLTWVQKSANVITHRVDYEENALTDARGFRKKFTALEDPTCAIELGLADGKGIGTFSSEQQQEWGDRLAREGDSPNMRKLILRERTDNLKKAGIAAPECN